MPRSSSRHRCLRLAAATLLVVISVLPAVRALAAEAGSFGRYRALVIGIDDYQYMTPLETAVNDAASVHAVLQQEFGFQSELLTNPDRYTLVRRLDGLRAELEPEHNLLLYFAGHGFLDREIGETYWLPVDAEEDSQANWVPVSTITRTLRAMAAKQVLVIVDSGYSGTVARDAPVRPDAAGDRPLELEQLSAKRARKALTSGGLQPVADATRPGHSVFSSTLVDVLRDAQEPIDGFTLFTRLRGGVLAKAGRAPRYGDISLSGDEGGDFVLIPVSATGVSEPAPTVAALDSAPGSVPASGKPTSFEADLAFWESIKDSDRPDEYAAYLEKFPDGVFAELARSRMAAAFQAAGSAQGALAPGVESVEVEPLSGDYVTMSLTNVRTGPASSFPIVDSVNAGSTVSVTGKVPGRNWVQLSENGIVIGYAYFVGLRPAPAVAADQRQHQHNALAQARAREREEAAARERRAEEQAAYDRYLDAQDRKEALELEREYSRRSGPYWDRYRYRYRNR